MSKYKQITTQITEREHIIQALDEMGIPYEVIEATETAKFNAYYKRNNQTISNAVIVRKRAKNDFAHIPYSDMAWVESDGMYECLFDEHGQQEIIEGVAQRAAMLKLQDLAFANGYELNVIEDDQNVQRVLVGRVS